MNQYIVDLISIIVVGIIFLIIYYQLKVRGKIKNNNSFVIISLIIIIIVGVFLPIEYTIIKFEKPKDVFAYYFPSGKVIKEYTSDDYSFILFSDKSGDGTIYYIKDGDTWRQPSRFNQFNTRSIPVNDNGMYIISVTTIPEKKVSAISVSSGFTGKEMDVSDSLSSKFDLTTVSRVDAYHNDIDDYIYTAIIEDDIDSNYKVSINGKEYQIFNLNFKNS